jgi:hypothetical protein
MGIMKMKIKNNICEEKLGEWLTARKSGDRQKVRKILDAVCFVTGLHRKSVSRKFRHLQLKRKSLRKKECRGRKRYYGRDVDMALKMIWESSGCICGELLHGVIGEYVEVFTKFGGILLVKLQVNFCKSAPLVLGEKWRVGVEKLVKD